MKGNTRAVVLIPVFNDWDATRHVIEHLDEALAAAGRSATVLIIDDGSVERCPDTMTTGNAGGVDAVNVLVLRRNLGHQRAIGVALAWLHRHGECDAVVIMDGDGEDDPSDVVRLLDRWEELGGRTIVFAERTRRSEGLRFRVSYAAFKIVHRVLTGRGIRVGNFSVVPFERVNALVTVPDLWNHYAAAVFVSRMPFTTIPTNRARRISGQSSMNFPALVNHGLSAISVFSEIVSVRVLLAALACMGVTMAAIATVVGIRVLTDLAIPGWATFTTGLLLSVLIQSMMFAVLFSFTVLSNRKGASVILVRDYEMFVDRLHYVDGRSTVLEGEPLVVRL